MSVLKLISRQMYSNIKSEIHIQDEEIQRRDLCIVLLYGKSIY